MSAPSLMTCSLRGLLVALSILQMIPPLLAEDRALIIGIDHYPSLPERKQLTGPVNDAHLMERVAREVWGFTSGQIKVLLNEQATSNAIRAELNTWLVAGTQAGDRVLLTYSGHGYYKRTGNPNEPDGIDETLAPFDVMQAGASYDNMILDDEIDAVLQRLEGRDVMVVVDACHSGTITRSLDPAALDGASIVRSLDQGRLTRGIDASAGARVVTEEEYGVLRRRKVLTNPHKHVLAWSAASSTEFAQEDMSLGDTERLGVFTRRFGEGLIERRAASGDTASVTVAALLDYVRVKAHQYCQSFPCRTGMTPSVEAPATMLSRDLLSWRPRVGQMAGAPALPATAPPPIRPADFFAPAHANGVRVDILPQTQVRLGETIKLRVTSDMDGWLIILDVRDDGHVVQLFPSRCARKERFVKAGAPLTLPDASYGCEFTSSELGSGQILAIVTHDNVALEGLLGRHRDLEIVSEPAGYLAEIADRLLKVWTGDERNRPVRWRLGEARYRVERN